MSKLRPIKHSEIKIGDIIGWAIDNREVTESYKVLFLKGSSADHNLKQISGKLYGGRDTGWVDFTKECEYKGQECWLMKREINLKTYEPQRRQICLKEV